MADDIIIKSASPQSDGQGQAQTQAQGQTSAVAPIAPVVAPIPAPVTAVSPIPTQISTPPQTPAPSSKAFNLAAEVDANSATSQNIADKYTIPALVKEKFPDLVELIKTTESMSDDEREYWFQILPIMTEDQISKLRDILVNEKQQLSKLDKEYEDELNRLNDKHMLEWKEFESKEKRRALTQAEQQAEAQEKSTEEDLLAKLNQI